MNRNSAEVLRAERAKRIEDAIALRQPDRVPIVMSAGYLLADLGGITKQQLLEDHELCQQLLEKAALEFQPDSIWGPMPADPTPSLILGDRQSAWPGHQLSPNSQFQFVEGEFMKEDEYDDFLEDPTDWTIRTYLPRVFEALESFAQLPPPILFLFGGGYGLANFAVLSSSPFAESFKAFARAVQVVAEGHERAARNRERMAALGFPPSFIDGAAILTAPFDVMSDAVRGMRGIMLDVMRRPDKLLAAQEKVMKFELKWALNFCRATGAKRAFLALHRGSDGFMSLKQFETLYWPQLKKVLETLIENGITPVVFYEGCWDQRLGHLAELPTGKSVGWFQASDIFKVKEVLGDTMCIMGGMPNSLLKAGPADEVRAYTKRLCQEVGRGGGFIMTTAVGELAGCNPELIKVWVEATKEYGKA